MDLDVILNAAGVVIVSVASIIVEKRARSVKKAVDKGATGSDEISKKLDDMATTIHHVNDRVINLQTSLTDHYEWHLKERDYRD